MKFYYVAFLFTALPLKAMSPAQVQQYVQHYAPPHEIKKTLDAIPYSILSTRQDQGKFFVKRDLTRLDGMELIIDAAQENKCPHVIVPAKYAYKRNNRPFVIATPVTYTQKPFTVELAQQIYTIVQATGYADIHGGNIKHTLDGKAAFIDTQMEGFKTRIPKNPKKQTLAYLQSIEMFLMLDQEATNYIKEKIATLQNA